MIHPYRPRRAAQTWDKTSRWLLLTFTFTHSARKCCIAKFHLGDTLVSLQCTHLKGSINESHRSDLYSYLEWVWECVAQHRSTKDLIQLDLKNCRWIQDLMSDTSFLQTARFKSSYAIITIQHTVSSTTLLDYVRCNGIFLSMNCESYRSFIQRRLCGKTLVNICLHTHTYTYAQRPRGSTVRHGMHCERSVCWCGLLV